MLLQVYFLTYALHSTGSNYEILLNIGLFCTHKCTRGLPEVRKQYQGRYRGREEGGEGDVGGVVEGEVVEGEVGGGDVEGVG